MIYTFTSLDKSILLNPYYYVVGSTPWPFRPLCNDRGMKPNRFKSTNEFWTHGNGTKMYLYHLSKHEKHDLRYH
jgi:hypothetical protein